MDIANLQHKAITMIVWNTQKENDVHVYSGKLKMENGEACFVNEEKGWKVVLDEEQLSRIQAVPGDLKNMLLHADYAFSMNMGELPETDSQTFDDTGIKWE